MFLKLPSFPFHFTLSLLHKHRLFSSLERHFQKRINDALIPGFDLSLNFVMTLLLKVKLKHGWFLQRDFLLRLCFYQKLRLLRLTTVLMHCLCSRLQRYWVKVSHSGYTICHERRESWNSLRNLLLASKKRFIVGEGRSFSLMACFRKVWTSKKWMIKLGVLVGATMGDRGGKLTSRLKRDAFRHYTLLSPSCSLNCAYPWGYQSFEPLSHSLSGHSFILQHFQWNFVCLA